MVLQTTHDIIGNSVAFFFRQPLAKSAHKLARAYQRKCNSEAQHVASSHFCHESGTSLSIDCRFAAAVWPEMAGLIATGRTELGSPWFSCSASSLGPRSE